MEVTAKAKDGTEIGKSERSYTTQASNCLNSNVIYGAQNKTSIIRDTSLQPYQDKTESFEFALPVDDKKAPTVRTADVTVELWYEIQNPDNKIAIHKVTREVTLDR